MSRKIYHFTGNINTWYYRIGDTSTLARDGNGMYALDTSKEPWLSHGKDGVCDDPDVRMVYDLIDLISE